MIFKLVLLLLIIGVLVFLYKRKNNEKKIDTEANDSDPARTESDTVEAAVTVESSTPSPESAEQEPAIKKETVVEEQTASSAEIEPTVELTIEPALPQLDWANVNLIKAVELRQAAANSAEEYSALVAAVSECYKQRKSQQYLIYGYSLTDDFVQSFDQSLIYRADNNISTPIKGTAFMQLATLAQDNGGFVQAIELCNKAIANDLSDGTVTGFEGRIKRIEKAKEKAAS